MNTTFPKISVVIATRNAASTLENSIKSFIAQTYPHKELLIIDGNSTDNTLEIIKSHRDHVSFYVSEKDKGISDAWNKGVAKTSGDWIYFLGADDEFVDEYVLNTIAPKLIQFKNHLIVYSKVEMIDEKFCYLVGSPWNHIEGQMKYQMMIPHQGTFHNKKLFDLCGYFNLNYKIAGDYELILKSLAFSTPVFVESFVVAKCNVGGLSTSYKHRPKTLLEFREASEAVFSKRIPFNWYPNFYKAKVLSFVSSFVGENSFRYLRKFKRSLLSFSRGILHE